MARRVAKPAKVSEVLAGYLKRAGIAERLAQAGVLQEWPALVGARIAAVSEAAEMSADGLLVVKVRTAPWATELSLMTPQIIARVNAGRKTGRVTRIHWVLAR